MKDPGRSTGLRTIFSFFLGLMLTAFAGVGVYTFYPPPEEFTNQAVNSDYAEALKSLREKMGAR